MAGESGEIPVSRMTLAEPIAAKAGEVLSIRFRMEVRDEELDQFMAPALGEPHSDSREENGKRV